MANRSFIDKRKICRGLLNSDRKFLMRVYLIYGRLNKNTPFRSANYACAKEANI